MQFSSSSNSKYAQKDVVYINQNSTVNMHKCNKSTSVKPNVEDYAEPCIINSYEKPLKKNMAKIFPLNDC